MVRIPLPQEPLRAPGSGGLSAPGVIPQGNAAPEQLVQSGQTALRAGLQLSNETQDLEERMHLAEVKMAYARAEEEITTADLNYTNKFGRDAVGTVRQDSWTALSKKLDTISSNLQHPVERDLFAQVRQQRLLALRARWGEHESRQIRAYEIGAGAAALEAKKEAAVHRGAGGPDDDRSDPTSAAYLLFSVRAEATSLAHKKGLSTEERDQFVKEQVAEVHAGILNDLTARGDMGAAREYFAKFENDLPTHVATKVRGVMARGNVKERSLRSVTEIQAALDNTEDAKASVWGRVPSEELRINGMRYLRAAHAGNALTAEEFEDAVGHLDRAVADRKFEEETIRSRTMDQVASELLSSNGGGYSALTPALQARVDALDLRDDVARYNADRKNFETDHAWFNKVLTSGGSSDLSNVAWPTVLAMAEKKGGTAEQIKQLRARWGDLNGVPDPDSIVRTKWLERLELIARQRGFFPLNTADPNNVAFTQFRLAAEEALRAFPETDPDRIDKAIAVTLKDDVKIEQTTFLIDAFGADTTALASTLSATDEKRAYFDNSRLASTWLDVRKELRMLNVAVPPALVTSIRGTTYLREINPQVREDIITFMRGIDRPVTQAEVAMWWTVAGRPKNRADLRRLGYQLIRDVFPAEMRQVFSGEGVAGFAETPVR